MREPFALLSALALAAAAGAIAILWPHWLGYTVAFVFCAGAFWLILSRDASFEREIDTLLSEHAILSADLAVASIFRNVAPGDQA